MRRLESDLHAALEGLVVRLRFAARETFTHGLHDEALLRDARLLQLERNRVGALLRQPLVELVIAARIGESRDADSHIRQAREQGPELCETRTIAVAHRVLTGAELNRRTDLAGLALDVAERAFECIDLAGERCGLGLARGERVTFLLTVLAHETTSDGSDHHTHRATSGCTDD